ncbi:DUF4920 domain-containing protein [soil metagenome]
MRLPTLATLVVAPAFLLAACTADGPTVETELTTPAQHDLGQFEVGAPISVEQALANAEEYDGQEVHISGTIREVCQQKGCWLTLEAEDATIDDPAIRVAIPSEDGDYLFTFPMGAAGGHAVVVGHFEITESSVELLRHLAEDRGATQEEINAITEPERGAVLTARGARVPMPADQG